MDVRVRKTRKTRGEIHITHIKVFSDIKNTKMVPLRFLMIIYIILLFYMRALHLFIFLFLINYKPCIKLLIICVLTFKYRNNVNILVYYLLLYKHLIIKWIIMLKKLNKNYKT